MRRGTVECNKTLEAGIEEVLHCKPTPIGSRGGLTKGRRLTEQVSQNVMSCHLRFLRLHHGNIFSINSLTATCFAYLK